MRVAFVTGVRGQDGHYLVKLLRTNGYRVVGATHRAEQVPLLQKQMPEISFVVADVTDRNGIASAIADAEPDEVYNLAGFSFPPASLEQPDLAFQVNAAGALHVLEAVRLLGRTKPNVKLYQASTSEMFGRTQEPPYDESTPLRPETPYAATKAAAHHLVSVYRERFGLFAVSGILFNHESPLRPPHYVTRKVTQAVARISLGSREPLVLGSLEAVRDWGFAPDYVEGMWLMMQREEPEDFVLATSEPHSVRDLVATAFKVVGIDSWEDRVETNPEFTRPPEPHPPIGDPRKALTLLGWKPQTGFADLVETMVRADLARLQGQSGPTEGFMGL